jgi:ribosomal protein S12 methylthiotransferase
VQKHLSRMLFGKVDSKDPLRIACISLGCSKNRIDTEEILGYFSNLGFMITDDPANADLVMVNTCSFIESAQKESVETLLKLARLKNDRYPLIFAAGCLVETAGTPLLNLLPELDGAIGVHSYNHLKRFIKLLLNGKRSVIKSRAPFIYRSLSNRILTESAHSVCVRIAEGCNNHCHYCLIPKIRGPYRSRNSEDIVEEIQNLLDRGTREIVLIAQDTTAYGSEQESAKDLVSLVKSILQLKKKFWLRIMYTYPSRINEQLIEQMTNDSRFCNYLDIPLQHISNRILKDMARHYSKEEAILLIDKLRSVRPGIAIRTTMMVGYPGEGKNEFEELKTFIEDYRFEHLGAFIYSNQNGTDADLLPNKVPKRVAAKRYASVMLTQQQISRQLNKKYIGKEKLVLIDRKLIGRKHIYFGRTEEQAPEVDGGVYIYSKCSLQAGDWITAKIVSASNYDLNAVLLCVHDQLP